MAKTGSHSPHLEPFQQKQAERFAPIQAVVVHEVLRGEGAEELGMPAHALLLSGLAGGLSMGFSFLGQALLDHEFEGAVGQHAIASFGYALGFIIVVLGRQQLFTESTLTATLPTFTQRDWPHLQRTLRLWALVFAANVVGTWIFAAGVAYGAPLPDATEPALAKLAAEAVKDPFVPVMVKAVFAGWLIALMVWLLPPAGSAKLLIIALLAWVVALAKLNHVVAGSAEAAYGVLKGNADLYDYVWRFMVPTVIGNTIGGVGFVALLNHAPVSHKVQPL